MSKVRWAFPCVVVISLLPLLAQDEARPQRAMPRYKSTNEITVQGVIEDVQQTASFNGLAGSYLTLRTPSHTLHVQLGTFHPAKNEFIPGETIQVTGSPQQEETGDLLLARQIKRGSQVLTIRNSQGLVVSTRGVRSSAQMQ